MRRFFVTLLGSFFAAFCGWLAGILLALSWGAVVVMNQPAKPDLLSFIALPWIVAIGSAYFVLPVWLLLLAPLYFLIPRSWLVWRWPICTFIGILAGIVIIGVFLSFPDTNPPLEFLPWYILAAVIAGTTCFIGSLTHERFRDFHMRI